MHSQASCDCYCKAREPTHRRRNGIQSDRSRVKLVTSKTSVCKTDTSRSERNVPLTPANLVNDDQDSKRSATTPLVSPVLSPETSAALENVDRLVKDAEIQIKAINMVADCNAFRTPVKTYSAEVSLDDENDQLLYVRERVASKFQEANGWPDANYKSLENEGTLYERTPRARSKRTTDFSAPKFKMPEERGKEFKCRASYGVQDPGVPATDTQSKERAKGPDEISNLERNSRLKTFTYQACPTVNIERQLTTQNLQSIHISPDPSFVQENANVATYIVSHGCRPKSQTRKEKFVKIFEESKDAASGKQSSEKQRRKHGRATNEVTNSNESSRSSVSKGSTAEVAEKSGGTSLANVGNDGEDAREREERAAISVENEDLESSSFNNRKSEDREVQVEIEAFEERTDGGAPDRTPKDAVSVKSDHKQVHFSEEVREDIVKPSTETGDDEERSKPFELEDETVPDHNFHPLEGSSIMGGNEGGYKKKEKNSHDEKNREHYKIIEENFASLRQKYCKQNDESVEEPSLFESSRVDTSGEVSECSADDELYYPAIDELDNVLLAYNSIIDEASQSMRTMDKYLTRPELREFLQSDEASQSSESPTPSQRNNFEPAKGKSVRDQRDVKHRHVNDAQRTCETMSQAKGARSVKLESARFNKLDYNSKNKYIPRKNSIDAPSISDAKFRRRTGADPRTSSNIETALTESDSDKIAKHIEKTLVKFFQVQRSRDANAFRASEESSSLTTSMNPSVVNTDTQSLREDKSGAMSGVSGNNVLEKDSSPPSNAATIHDFEQAEARADLENKIKDALDLEEMMPILVKNLLQNFQNGATSSPHNLELLITENAPENNVDSNVHEMETARLKTDDKSEKNYSETEIRRGAMEIVKSGVDITEKNANGELHTLVNVNADFVDKPASRFSNSEQLATSSWQENSAAEPSKINANTESSRELLSAKNDSASNRKMENSVTSNNDGSSASTRNVSSIAAAKMEADENRADERMRSDVAVCVDTVSETMNNLSGKNKETECTRPQDSVNEEFLSKPSSKVENEEIESRLDQNNTKVPVECDDSARRASSSDSLRDCVSLPSSSRNEPKLLNMMESIGKINEINQHKETNNAVNSISNRVFNEKHPRGHIFEKEKILSDLYDEIHEQLLHSTFAMNHSAPTQQNTRTLEDVPPTVSQTVESVSLDTSRSEGELFMPSSGSCSLGEIKMLNTNEQDNIITVFVTKETLSLWSESSKSLVRSIGEI
ncbi:uncharacterized protein LOC144470665 [Augochlora pura]